MGIYDLNTELFLNTDRFNVVCHFFGVFSEDVSAYF